MPDISQAVKGLGKFKDLFLPPQAIGLNITMRFSAGIYLLPCVSRTFVVAEVAHSLVVTNAPTYGEVVEPFPRQPKVPICSSLSFVVSDMPYCASLGILQCRCVIVFSNIISRCLACQVEVLDEYGNLCTWYEDTGAQNEDGIATEGIVVVAALYPPPGVAAAMLGMKSKLVVDGRVIFTDLSVDKPGIGFTIQFRVTRGVVDPAAVKRFTIDPFNVSYGYPYRLVFGLKPGSETEIQDPRGAVPGIPMIQQPRIIVQDMVGNIVGDERGILEITATLLQSGRPAARPLTGNRIMKSCLYKNEATGGCQCLKAVVSGCGIAQWPVTQNGIRIDGVGRNYTILFEATFRETILEADQGTGVLLPKIREIILKPVQSIVFEVSYGSVHSLQITKEPWGFVLNEEFLGQPVVAVYDKAGNFVPTNEVEIISHFVVVALDGSSLCCFDLSFKQVTDQGYAIFKGMKLTRIPVQGNVLKLRFSSLIIEDYVESESFVMANKPVKIKVVQQPEIHDAGIGFRSLPKVALLDQNETVAGWYKDAPMNVTATLCVEIPCVSGKFVGNLRTATPCFKCTTDTSKFCDIQTQTPVQLKPRTIFTEKEMIQGKMWSVAYNGVSTFTNLVIDKIGTYKIRFNTPGYPFLDSNPFTIFHGVATHLHLQAQPKGAYSGAPLSQQPVVVIRDAGRNIVTSDLTTIITASLVNSRRLLGAKLLTANDNIMGPHDRVTHGVLYWQRLQVDVSGTYELLFTASLGNCTPVTSESFEILRSPPVKLAVVKPPDDCLRGKLCKVQPIVEVQDLQGNKVLVKRKFNTSITAISCAWSSRFNEREVVEGSLQMNEIGIFQDSLWHATCDGKYQLEVSASGLESAKSAIFQVSDPATNTTVVLSPTPGLAGEEIRQQPRVQLVDAVGRRVRGTSASITASLLKCDNGGPCKPFTLAPVIGSQAANTSLGQANFTNLRLDMAGTCYRFLFSAPGMLAGKSSLFDVKVGTVVSVLQLVRQPPHTGAMAGLPFPNQPVVNALDAGKNIMLFQSSLQITATLLVDAERSVDGLKGDRTTVVQNGVGTFTDLSTRTRGNCMKLTFEVYGKTTLSDIFQVGPAAPFKLHLAVQPSQPHVGWAFGVQPVLYFQDRFDNVVNHVDCKVHCHLLNTTVIASLLPVSFSSRDSVLHGTTQIKFQSDPSFGTRASFTNLRIDRAGRYSFIFSSVSGLLESVVSQDVTVITAEDRANHLDVLVQPYGVRSIAPMIIQPVVAIHDLGNNIIKSADTNITARLLGGYTCGTLQHPDKFRCGPWVTDHAQCGSRSNCVRTSALLLTGTRTVETKNGIATFTDLWITGQPTRFVQLEFTSDLRCTPSDGPCDPIKSYVFDVAGAVAYISLMETPSAYVVAGEPLAIQPRLGIFDASGRRYTWAPPGSVQVINATSYQNVSTWCNSSQTREELAGTGYDCNINRTNTSALNISQYGAWNGLEGNATGIQFLESFVNFTDLRFDRVARSRSGYHLNFGFRALTGEQFYLDWCCVQVAPAKAHSLEIFRQPEGPRVGEPFETQPILRIMDRFGNLATNEVGEVKTRLFLNHKPAPIGTVERVFGSNVASAERGVVRFRNLGYNQTGKNFTVGFAFPSVPIAFSNEFEMLPGTKIFYLHIARAPQGFSQNRVLVVQPIIETHDLGGNTIVLNTTDIPMIQVSLVNSTSGAAYNGARLMGQTLVNASRGSANFGDLAISKAGSGMKLRFELVNSTEFKRHSETIWRMIPPANVNETAVYVPNGTFSNVSISSVYIESDNFQVANNATTMTFTREISAVSTGGLQFEVQPIINLNDQNGFLVSNHDVMIVTAELWMHESTEERCPESRPWRCGMLTGLQQRRTACALNEDACPKLKGTTTKALTYGVAAFDDLYINGCNEFGRDGCSQAKYKIRFTSTTSCGGPGQPQCPAGGMRGTIVLDSRTINITVGKPVGAMIYRQPVPLKAALPLSTQPSVWIVDAGGNRVTDWSENARATLVRGRIDACCDSCECPAWSGKSELAPVNGAFDFDNVVIDTAGDYKFMFTSGIYSVESNLFTVDLGPATQLRIIRQPLPGLTLYGGNPFQTQPRLEVLDAGFNVVKDYMGDVKAELLPNEFGAALTGASTAQVRKGIATYFDVGINKEGSCYVVRYSSRSLRSVEGIPLTVDVGLPSRMQFITQPSGFRPGYSFDVQPILAIVDEGGNIIPNAQDSIEATLFDADQNPLQGGLCSYELMGAPVCETAVRAVNGVAIFSGLRVDTAGKGYTLVFGKARGGYKTVTTTPFDVNVGPAFQLFVDKQPRMSSSQPGFLFTGQPHITILDAGGNLVPVADRQVIGELYLLNQPASDTKPELWQVQMQLYDPEFTAKSIIDRVIARPTLEGKAVYSNLRVDVAAAGYIIRFRSANMLSVDSTIFSIGLGAPYTTSIFRSPFGLKSGAAFIVQPVLHIVDRGMNTLHGHNPEYDLISSIESGEGVMYPFPREYGILPIRDGVTVFSKLTITGRGAHTIKFSAFNLRATTTAVFNVSGESHAVSVNIQPVGSVASALMTVHPETYIRDDRTVIVDTDSSSRVTVSIVPESNPNSAVLSGTLTVDCCWGQCKFTNLVISKSGQKYRLAFSSSGLKSDYSQPFEVGGPAKLVVASEPASAISESAIGNQPVIHVTDMWGVKQAYCNRNHCDIGGPAQVTATIKDGTGGLELCKIQGNNVAAVVNGVAAFTNLEIKGSGRSFQERKYVLEFKAIDLYMTESAGFILGYTKRDPTNYVQAAVQLTRYSVFTFTPKEQTLFVNTLAKYLGILNTEVEIVTVKDVIIRFRNEIRRVLSSPEMFALPSFPGASRGMLPAPPGQILLRQTVQDAAFSVSIMPLTVEHDVESEAGAQRRAREEPGIDIRFRVFSNNTEDLFRIKDDLTALLKREGALAEKLNDEGLSNLKTVMAEAPEVYTPSGGVLPPIVKFDPSGAIAGSLVGAFLLFACTVGCYTMWFRARKRALIRAETEVDAMNLLYALGIEDPKVDIDAAMPWTAEKMLESSREEVMVIKDRGKEKGEDA
jgi:hypothetical protein